MLRFFEGAFKSAKEKQQKSTIQMHQQWYPQMNTSSSQVPPWQPTATPYGSNLGMPRNNFPLPGTGETSSRAGPGNNFHLDPEAGKPKNSLPGVWPVSVNLPQDVNPGDTNVLGQLQAQMMGNQLDPYFIGDGTSSFYEFIYPFCDWTFLLMLLFALGSAVGLGIVLGEQQTDNIFASLGVENNSELDKKIALMIKVKDSDLNITCETALFGSFGSVCLNDCINSQFFLLLLSHLNVGRGALWCLALFFSFIALAIALIVHAQRHPRTNAFDSPFFQAEFLQMSPAQQALFVQQNFQPPGCCGSSGVEVYDTPYYAFFRFAWGFTGIVAFIWGVMLLIPTFTIIPYFIDHTTEELQVFWQNYYRKFLGTIFAVIIYLAWPIMCLVLEALVWVVGIVPWAVIRMCLKPGIERFRPEMKLSELPGYIRADMFFMDFQDLKRFGFSRLQWNLLTDTYQPFFECWDDPLLIRDPEMMKRMVKSSRALLLSQATAAAGAASIPTPAESSFPNVIPSGMRGESMAKPGSKMQEAGADEHEERTRHHRRTDYRNAGEEGEAETGERGTPSPGHHRHGRSGGHNGASRSHRHRSGRSEGNSGSGENGQTGEREVAGEESHQRRRHRGNRENSSGEGSGHRHRHSNSGRRSHGSGRGNEDGSRSKGRESIEVSRSLSKPIDQLEELMKI